MPRGGARPGAGRKKGGTNSLPVIGLGIVLNTARIAAKRLAADKEATPEDHLELAKVYQVVGKVLNCEIHPDYAGPAIKAAGILAEAIAAPRVQKVELKDERAHARLAFTVADRVLGPAVPIGDGETH
jgi:hypothetical protein